MSKGKPNRQSIIKIVGNIFTILGMGFIVLQIKKFDVDFWFLLNPNIIILIFLLALLLVPSIFTDAIAWKNLVEMLSHKKLKNQEIIHVYAKSNIAKYLPGNIFHYASRNLLGSKYEISQKDMLVSSALEIGLKVFCAFVLVLVLIQGELLTVINRLREKTSLITTVIIVSIGIVLVVALALLGYKKRTLLKGRLRIFPLLFAFLSYIFGFAANAVAVLLIAHTLIPKAEFSIVYTAGIYISAWLLGYLTPGSPGGIGIRETVMVLMLGSVFTAAGIAQIAVALRLVTILADVIGFAADMLVTNRITKIRKINIGNKKQ